MPPCVMALLCICPLTILWLALWDVRRIQCANICSSSPWRRSLGRDRSAERGARWCLMTKAFTFHESGLSLEAIGFLLRE